MASKLHQMQAKATRVSNYMLKNGGAYYKQLIEKNKQHIQDPATVETCQNLAKQLFYTRLASIPVRYEAFWKEPDYFKHLFKHRHELKIEDAGIAALFGFDTLSIDMKSGDVTNFIKSWSLEPEKDFFAFRVVIADDPIRMQPGFGGDDFISVANFIHEDVQIPLEVKKSVSGSKLQGYTSH